MDQLLQLRHNLHAHPELSGHEINTASILKTFLIQYNPDVLEENIGGHGLVAGYKFGDGEPRIMLRCELDALPIDESIHLPYGSEYGGISHKCGHDGHMVMVAGMAQWLAKASFDKGTVYLLFQPAEETGRGAKAMLNDPKFTPYIPDYIFALHNLPGYPKGSVIQLGKMFNMTVLSIAIYIKGTTSHASEPEKGKNPSLTIATLLSSISSLTEINQVDENYVLITPVHTSIGQKDYGISPGSGEVHFTIRTLSSKKMDEILNKIESLVENQCQIHALEYDIKSFDYFPCVINDNYCNNVVEHSAKKANIPLIHRSTPVRFGEDFGYFTQHIKGAMFGLGSGEECPPLHSIHYDFPDDIIAAGINMYKGIISYILKDN